MGVAKAVTTEEWQVEVIASDKVVLVDFWAEWCGPCRMVGPVVEEIASEQAAKLKVLKLDVDENPQISRDYGILSIPTLMIFKGGEVAKRMVGAKSKQQLMAELAEFLA
jgi:thioredoxin